MSEARSVFTSTSPMLLLESDPILRRTVVLTARSLGLLEIEEASSIPVAHRLLRERPFRGAVVSLEFGHKKLAQYDLTILDQIRHDQLTTFRNMPIAVMVERCDDSLLRELQQRGVGRIILKPFRARALLDTFSAFQSLAA